MILSLLCDLITKFLEKKKKAAILMIYFHYMSLPSLNRKTYGYCFRAVRWRCCLSESMQAQLFIPIRILKFLSMHAYYHTGSA